MESTSLCLAPGCARTLATEIPFCSRHWDKLPDDLKSDFWTSLRKGADSEGRSNREVVTACVQAITEFLVKQQERFGVSV